MTAEAGFDLKIRITEFATSLNEAEAGRFQAYALDWSGRADPDGNLYIFHKTGAPQNYGGYANPQVDAALDEARVKSAVAERKAIYEKVAGTLLKPRARWSISTTGCGSSPTRQSSTASSSCPTASCGSWA